MSAPKKVVILGLGYGGIAAARALDDAPQAGKAYEIVGIDKHKSFWHTFGVVRATVNADYAKKFVVPYDSLLTHGKVLTETTVTDITPSEVVTSAGERIPFDYLVISTGSTYRGFIKAGLGIDASLEQMRSIREAAAKPNAKITIVGAGIVGLEFAGEIKNSFPGASITVVDANPKVLFHYEWPDSVRKDLVNKLDGVNFILNERVVLDEDDDGAYVKHRVSKLSSGATLESDVQILTVGNMTPNNALLKQTFLGALLDEAGRLKVNAHLQVEGHSNIFAIGDIGNVPVLKAAMQAQREAGAVAKSINDLINGRTALKTYAPMMSHQVALMAISPSKGAAAGLPFKGWGVTGWLGNKFASFKGQDHFISKIRESLRA